MAQKEAFVAPVGGHRHEADDLQGKTPPTTFVSVESAFCSLCVPRACLGGGLSTEFNGISCAIVY
jgi:hypothetical protein